MPVISIESFGWLADGAPMEYDDAVYGTRDQRIHLVVTAAGRVASSPLFPVRLDRI